MGTSLTKIHDTVCVKAKQSRHDIIINSTQVLTDKRGTKTAQTMFRDVKKKTLSCVRDNLSAVVLICSSKPDSGLQRRLHTASNRTSCSLRLHHLLCQLYEVPILGSYRCGCRLPALLEEEGCYAEEGGGEGRGSMEGKGELGARSTNSP